MKLFIILLLCGALILGFFFIVDSVIYMIANTGDRGEARRRRRLAIEKASAVEARRELLAKEPPAPKFSLNSYLDNLLLSAGSTAKREKVFLAAGAVAFSTMAIELLFARWLALPLQVLVAAGLGVWLPIARLQSDARQRLDKFNDQFPDALDLIVRSLRIGHPLATSIQTIAAESPAPTGPEFEIVSRQIMYGKSPAEAIDTLARRIESADVRFFSVAVQIHHESGGNLGDILMGLSRIIRSRFQLFRKVRALTAEGRFSAYFLSLFPVAMIFAMNALQPGYYLKVSDYIWFPHLIAGTVVALIVNVFAMRMITRLEV